MSGSIPVSQEFPLYVDLDGTLVKTDVLVESVLALLKINPLYLLLFPVWLLKGKSYFKREIAQRVNLDVTCLPYNGELVKYITEEYQRGRRIVLATAADVNLAKQVAKHLGIFTGVIASDGVTNLAGCEKLKAIESHSGADRFAYAGNAKPDLSIWGRAHSAIVVNASAQLVRRVYNVANVWRIFPADQKPLQAFAKAIRVHQWAKNALIFVPLITAHQVTNLARVSTGVLAFLAFSLCASSVYLLNDLLDLEADRHHPQKKSRPFAAGDLSLKVGLLAAPLFLCGAIALSLHVSFSFTLILSIYFLLTLVYSFYLKRIMLADIILLAVLYTIRIVAGGAAVSIAISEWLLLFALFFFLSLAFVKRFAELQARSLEGSESRGYVTNDLNQLASMGTASGYVALLVFALYLNSEKVKALYSFPEALWLICPLMLYWISRVWILAHRGHMHEDPVMFALQDKVSYIIGALIAGIMVLAMCW